MGPTGVPTPVGVAALSQPVGRSAPPTPAGENPASPRTALATPARRPRSGASAAAAGPMPHAGSRPRHPGRCPGTRP
eukprot:5113371-Alexandrium_andersonii.AAC.1